jgi:hypothetical protein
MRRAVPIVVLQLLTLTPASAITPQQKMETCKFGADNQKLTGAARKTFISKCMADDKSPNQPTQ